MRPSSVHGDAGTRDLTGVVVGLAMGSSCALGVQITLGFYVLVAILSLFSALDNKYVCCCFLVHGHFIGLHGVGTYTWLDA